MAALGFWYPHAGKWIVYHKAMTRFDQVLPQRELAMIDKALAGLTLRIGDRAVNQQLAME